MFDVIATGDLLIDFMQKGKTQMNIFGGCAVYRFLTLGKQLEDLTDSDLKNIVTFANAAASRSTEKMGGIPSIPTLDEC